MEITIRLGDLSDFQETFKLYKDVAAIPGGLARKQREINDHYIHGWIERSLKNGLWLLATDKHEKVLGSIHAYELGPEVFSHIYSELTIAVHPDHQKKKIGRKLFESFLKKIESEKNHISRVELIARESNSRAIEFYQSLGFKIEGRLINRIKNSESGFEADIPMAWFKIKEG